LLLRMIPFRALRFSFFDCFAYSFVCVFTGPSFFKYRTLRLRFVCASFALRFVLRRWPPSFEASELTRLVHSSSLNSSGRGNMSGGVGVRNALSPLPLDSVCTGR
jgi:hypothetical protein